MKPKFFAAATALTACSSAWAEVVYLDCKTTNPDATDRVYVVDTQRMTGSVATTTDTWLLEMRESRRVPLAHFWAER